MPGILHQHFPNENPLQYICFPDTLQLNDLALILPMENSAYGCVFLTSSPYRWSVQES